MPISLNNRVKSASETAEPKPSIKKGKRQWASVSVPWGNETATINIGPTTWKRIGGGEAVALRSTGWNDGERFTLYWDFNSSADYQLQVSYGNDGADAFLGDISDADLKLIDSPRKHASKDI